MKVGYQGARGAYSEEAIGRYFWQHEDITPVGHNLSEEVLEALEKDEISYAVLPVENSIAGTVSMNMDLLLGHEAFAVAEIYLPIHHHLLAHEGVKLKDLKTIISHPIALGQCQKFIKKYQLKPIAEFDTAGACEILSQSEMRETGVIASQLCAEVYGLNILSDDIQQVKKNITRFLVLAKKDPQEYPEADKVSLAFSTSHRPGALLDCLKIFKDYGLNMTRLESRPIPENPFIYTFYVDFLGELNNKVVKKALIEIENHTEFFKIIGHYKTGS